PFGPVSEAEAADAPVRCLRLAYFCFGERRSSRRRADGAGHKKAAAGAAAVWCGPGCESDDQRSLLGLEELQDAFLVARRRVDVDGVRVAVPVRGLLPRPHLFLRL